MIQIISNEFNFLPGPVKNSYYFVIDSVYNSEKVFSLNLAIRFLYQDHL